MLDCYRSSRPDNELDLARIASEHEAAVEAWRLRAGPFPHLTPGEEWRVHLPGMAPPAHMVTGSREAQARNFQRMDRDVGVLRAQAADLARREALLEQQLLATSEKVFSPTGLNHHHHHHHTPVGPLV